MTTFYYRIISTIKTEMFAKTYIDIFKIDEAMAVFNSEKKSKYSKIGYAKKILITWSILMIASKKILDGHWCSPLNMNQHVCSLRTSLIRSPVFFQHPLLFCICSSLPVHLHLLVFITSVGSYLFIFLG